MHNVKIIVRCAAWSDEDTQTVTAAIHKILEKGEQEGFLSPHLSEIIVSDTYLEDWKQIAERWNLHSKLSEEAEYVSVGKLCFNKQNDDPKYILLFHPTVFGDAGYVDQFYTFMLSILAEDSLPAELESLHEYRFQTPPKELAKVFFSGIFQTWYSYSRMQSEGRQKQAPPISPRNLVAPFKRKVKRLHWQHQADLNFEVCVMTFFAILLRLLTQAMEASFYNVDYREYGEFQEPIGQFVIRFHDEALKILKGEDYSLDFLQQSIIDISQLCFFKITENPYDIKVADTPKNLFRDLIDTHQRIVAFVDILGFSELIKQYDENGNVVLLRDLKEALDTSIEEMQKLTTRDEEEVEVKLFSDCLCLSAAWFDNDYDFAYQFSRLMLGIKTYQLRMLLKGYLVRGGISMGSYYSDNNMIFSGALVEAANFEKYCTTQPNPTGRSGVRSPRILVSPRILTKLTGSTIHKTMAYYYKASLVKDNADGEIFLNPLLDTDISKAIYNDALESLKTRSPELYEASRKAVEVINTALSKKASDSIYDEIIGVLGKNIEQTSDNVGVAEKYRWTRAFIDWVRTGCATDQFTLQHIPFKSVVTYW
jgi:hypothetical protein